MFIVGFLVMAGISLILFCLVYIVVRNYLFKISMEHDNFKRAALRELEARAEEIDDLKEVLSEYENKVET